jgi:hypothetical protein
LEAARRIWASAVLLFRPSGRSLQIRDSSPIRNRLRVLSCRRRSGP